MYSYDQYGWLTAVQNTERSTDKVPPIETDTLKANWTGLDWVLVEYVAPPAPTPAPTVRRISKLNYMDRFTDAELAGIYTAAKTVVQVEVWLAKFNATTPDPDGTSIDLDDPRTVAGVQGLEAAGLLGAGRAAEILA